MTRTVITGTPADDLTAVAVTMTNKRFRHLPVLDGGKLVGVISLGDVMKAQRDEYLGEVDTLQTQLIGERTA
jgi:CBS domain-containing protein